ncbi:DUF72 domain-containing protein [Candidatus Palauibacter sp.]|uniref:DUF72 domain-containing protein n=1 Tax=Candidatus Palauibacter sp. TaxID=3101350 RepID=UPI003B02DDC8
MQVWTGTSGYSYPAWKGSFYPEDLPNREMLSFYGSRLGAVEINNTFYRMPRESVLEAWAEAVPDGFRFALKASRRITHFKRLRDADEETEYLVQTTAALADRAGVILYQLPPNFKRDDQRLARFVDQLPNPGTSAFEFRHASWFDEGVFDILRDRNCALCLAETDDLEDAPLVETADWTYLRLRRSAYSTDELETWAARLRDSGWTRAYAFFKHEDAGVGPALAGQFSAMVTEMIEA